MNYEIYSEESNVIGFYDYTIIRNKIADNRDNKISRQGRQRSIYFNQDINYLVDISGKEGRNSDTYSINIYDKDSQHMILEKRSQRDGTIYRQHTYITLSQCDRIIHGQIDWMKDSENLLFRDLFLQMTINQKWPGVIVDYTRQVYRLGYSGDFLIFDTSLESSYDVNLKHLTASELGHTDFHMENRLEMGKVIMTYRQGMGMPKVLAGIMDLSCNYRLAGN